MADHTITIANATTALGMSPPNLWNAYNWNAFLWGYTLDLPLDVTHLIEETVTGSPTLGFGVTHDINESVGSDTTIAIGQAKAIAESVTINSDLASETLQDAAGYFHVFPGGTTDGEQRAFPTWSTPTAGSASWTSGTAGSTTWS